MIEIVWEFVVTEEARGRFELVWGPGGAWSNLFAQCPGFRGTTVLRDTENPLRYLTFDIWDTAAHREQALAEHAAGYSELNASLTEWTEFRTEVGVFTMRAEATVRPIGRGRRRPTEAGRRNRQKPR
jgi:heme-degrading monooxygenase HmoA